MYQAFEALGRPLSPDARRFAYYDTAQDLITLLNLTNAQQTQLPVTTRSGCWLNSQQFVAAGPKRILEIKHGADSLLPGWLAAMLARLPEAKGFSKYLDGMQALAKRHREDFSLTRPLKKLT